MSILQQLIEWDKELLLFLNSMHTPFGDKFMWVYTGKYTWIPLILSLLFVLFRKNWKEALLVCVALLWAIVNCYSRIYLGVHYPGDILAGIISGTIIAVIICIVLNGFRSFLLNKKFLNNRESPYIKDPDIRITTGVIYLSVLCIAVYALIATYS